MSLATLVLAERVVIKFTAYAQRASPGSPDWVSALSVKKRDLWIFMPVLFMMWVLTVTLLAYVQYTAEPHPFVLNIVPSRTEESGHVYRIAERFGVLVIPLVAVAMVVTPTLKVGATAVRKLFLLLAHRLPRRLAMAISNILSGSFVEQRVAEIRAEGVAQVRDQIHAQGKAEGKVEGEAKANRLWQEWNRRRMEAEAEGSRFDEPPPA